MVGGLFLVAAVVAVGVLHTLVPDHWLPIALLAREHGWTKRRTARTAFVAGLGHVLTTLLIGLVVWGAGVAVAAHYSRAVDVASGVALIAFGLWTAVAAFMEQRDALRAVRHRHIHRHEEGLVHTHMHVHEPATAHDACFVDEADPPLHHHAHSARGRSALVLILGSSPMVEGIPLFFAAARYGPVIILVMSLLFAASTIATYVVLCGLSAQRLSMVGIGPLERYGEVLSGGLIALVGAAFLLWPIL